MTEIVEFSAYGVEIVFNTRTQSHFIRSHSPRLAEAVYRELTKRLRPTTEKAKP